MNNNSPCEPAAEAACASFRLCPGPCPPLSCSDAAFDLLLGGSDSEEGGQGGSQQHSAGGSAHGASASGASSGSSDGPDASDSDSGSDSDGGSGFESAQEELQGGGVEDSGGWVVAEVQGTACQDLAGVGRGLGQSGLRAGHRRRPRGSSGRWPPWRARRACRRPCLPACKLTRRWIHITLCDLAAPHCGPQ